MKNFALFVIFSFISIHYLNSQDKYEMKTAIDKNNYSYQYFTNDPLNTRIYSLENGLKVYLSVNKDEPRINTIIAVNAGSKSDPETTTGLAHYFEHMMFKGTDEIGTLNWPEEKKLLNKISGLFELYRQSTDSVEMKNIYRRIDSISTIAAQYAVTNEYDKLVSGIGAKETNAGTSYDMTIYLNDIPSNELHRWAELEYERFSDMVLRIFHTELETVYEEYNMYQDQDNSRARNKLFSLLFPSHPYGRMIIGYPEHLKKPSVKNIYEFADTWYVPNNMAIILSGDINYEESVRIIDQTFGKLKPKELPERTVVKENPLIEPVEEKIAGPSAESLFFAFRFDEGAGSEMEKYVKLIDMILSNSKAGLIDLNLLQQQKILDGGCSPIFLKDYGMHYFYGRSREGQSLEEVKNLLFQEIQKIKNGEFEDWMIEAVVNNLKLNRLQQQESNKNNAYTLMQTFINGQSYLDYLKIHDDLEKITKEDLVAFANKYYNENYAVVYKTTGPKDRLVKVKQPEITPLKINREKQSEYYKNFISTQAPEIEPVFIDFNKEISSLKMKGGLELDYIQNPTNEIFSLFYILDIGKSHNLMIPLAVNYLPYLGTDKYSPAELRKEFYKIGVNFGVSSSDDRTYIYITGLESNLEKGVQLFEHLLANVQEDEQAYKSFVQGILKSRQNQKLNQNTILWKGMVNYGMYGPNSPFTTRIPDQELMNINPSELTNLLKKLYNYEHKLFYYGKMEADQVIPVIEEYRKVQPELLEYPEPVKYQYKDINKNIVYFVNYDIVQANIIMMAKDQIFNPGLLPEATIFNEYFGSGLSSIVFQEIRESRALAYSAFANFNVPGKKDDHHYVLGYLGTQADKLQTATVEMLKLINKMPRSQKQFNLAKETIKKRIQTERLTRQNIYFTFLANQDKGIDHDTRKEIYENLDLISMENMEEFFNKHIAGHNYTFLVLANKENIDMNVLQELGTVKELSMEDVFGY